MDMVIQLYISIGIRPLGTEPVKKFEAYIWKF